MEGVGVRGRENVKTWEKRRRQGFIQDFILSAGGGENFWGETCTLGVSNCKHAKFQIWC